MVLVATLRSKWSVAAIAPNLDGKYIHFCGGLVVNTPTKRQGIPIALSALGLIMVIAGLLFATVLRPDSTVTAPVSYTHLTLPTSDLV